VEYEEEVLQRIQELRNEKWDTYEKEVQDLQKGLTR